MTRMYLTKQEETQVSQSGFMMTRMGPNGPYWQLLYFQFWPAQYEEHTLCCILSYVGVCVEFHLSDSCKIMWGPFNNAFVAVTSLLGPGPYFIPGPICFALLAQSRFRPNMLLTKSLYRKPWSTLQGKSLTYMLTFSILHIRVYFYTCSFWIYYTKINL